MPGRNPTEAVKAFLRPLQEATAVLDAHTHIVTHPMHGWAEGREYAWMLNDEDGVDLGKAGTFQASMRFQVVRSDPAKHEGVYRVTTRGYRYQFRTADGILWRFDWHPSGPAARREPHLHRPPNLDLHWPTSRVSFENALRWCILSGAPATCDEEDRERHLATVEGPFQLYRSWAQHPDEPRG